MNTSANLSIPLSKGFTATVSPQDYEELSKFKWYAIRSKSTKSWIAVRPATVNGKETLISMSRQILGLQTGDPRQADHRDHNTLNNCRENLRVVTRSQNCMNRQRRSDNTSTYKGVSWEKATGSWRVQIWNKGTNVVVGRYADPVEGARAYDEAANYLYGEYACLNFQNNESPFQLQIAA